MPDIFIQFAAEAAQHAEGAHAATEEAGGISALGLNGQAFLFQLISFVIVLVILRQFVFKKLVATLEDRRQAVVGSLEQAAATEAEVKKTEARIADMLKEARVQADDIVAAGHKEGVAMVEAAESKAQQRAEHIVTEAKAQMDVELTKAREALKSDTAKLVALATEKIIREKIDPTKDAALINDAVAKARERA